MVKDNTALEFKAPTDVARWAFDIHKDADALLHSRIQGFMAFNAILGGGFFLSARFNQLPGDALVKLVPPIIAFFAICFGIVFLTYMRRMVTGIRHLKGDILLNDSVYKHYYGGHRPADGVRYWFAYVMPGALVVLWSVLLAIGVMLAVR